MLPGKPKHLAAIGFALFQLGRLQEAESRLEEAVRRAPNYALAWFHLGNTKIGLGDVDGGRACFAQALQAQPGFLAAQEAMEKTR